MSERRYDPTADEWVTISGHRQRRTYKPSDSQCPLCPNGARHGGEIDRSSFEIAVFDNRFPAFSSAPAGRPVEIDAELRTRLAADLLPTTPAYGHCEVVVYCDRHNVTLADAGIDTVRLLIDVWADRYRILGAEGCGYVMPFENKGDVVGVTLNHPHGQIYGYPDVPPRPLRELRAAAGHRRRTGRCVECDVIAAEIECGDRIVASSRNWIAHVPFWARFPYEVRLAPRRHRPSLLEVDREERDELAVLLTEVLITLDRLFGFSMPYVMALFSRPTGGEPAQAGWSGDWDDISHLHLLISPPYRSADRLKYLAGSELMAGAFLSDVAPELAAHRLRQARAS